MRRTVGIALSIPVALTMFANWWLFYGTLWMDEVNHALFGVLLFLLIGRRAIYVVPIVALGWEAWELWRYPIGAFTPGPSCYQDDTLLDLVLPLVSVLLVDRFTRE